MKASERIENYLLEQEIKSYIEVFPFMICLLDMDLTNKQTVLLFEMIDQENIKFSNIDNHQMSILQGKKYMNMFSEHIITIVDDMVRKVKLQVFA